MARNNVPDRNRWFEQDGRDNLGHRKVRCRLCLTSLLASNKSRHLRSKIHMRRDGEASERERSLMEPIIPYDGPQALDPKTRYFVDDGFDPNTNRKMRFCRLCGFRMLASNVARHCRARRHGIRERGRNLRLRTGWPLELHDPPNRNPEP